METSSATEDAPSNRKKDAVLVFTAATYAISFILIGLPLWWKTTNVYRVSLPYSEIEELSSLQISHLIPVTVVLTDRNVHQGSLWEKLSLLAAEESSFVENQHLQIQYAWKMRTALENEENVVKESKDHDDLDQSLHFLNNLSEAGVYHILVLDKQDNFSSNFVGCHRRGYVVSDVDTTLLAKNIIATARTIIQADFLQKIYSPASSYERKMPEKDRMRFLSPTTAFDITFSLIVPEPHIVNIHWDIQAAIDAYIIPFTSKISLIYDVEIKSQILYMTSLPLQTSFDEKSGERLLNAEQLPSLINPVEGKLGSYASVNPTLNFVIYVVPQEQSPLRIIDKKGEKLSTNAFLSPQWGGFMIKNFKLESQDTPLPHSVTLNMQEVMDIFLGQLKLLLGLPNMENVKNKQMQVLHGPQCCEWELDFLLRKNAQEQLSFAVSSLYSLGQLLQTISNIVIRDEIGDQIYYSVSAIKHSIHCLQQGFLEEGFLNAKNAFNASESAFFDPSLLALLYFPDDQKYAIYIPLFLPISIPVIMSLRQMWNYWNGNRKKLKTE